MSSLHLSALPRELQLDIIDLLGFPDTAFLRATCRWVASLIPAHESNWSDLVAIDDCAWALKRRRLTCSYCARMRPANRFSDKSKGDRASIRSCFECQEAAYYSGGTFSQYWTGYPLHGYRRTRLSQKKRKLNVTRDETGICGQCHNVFRRWGRTSTGRGICSGCFLDPEGSVGIYESSRLSNDLKRAGEGKDMTGQDIIYGDEVQCLRSGDQYAWWLNDDWVNPAFLPAWGATFRGVKVVRQVEHGGLAMSPDAEKGDEEVDGDGSAVPEILERNAASSQQLPRGPGETGGISMNESTEQPLEEAPGGTMEGTAVTAEENQDATVANGEDIEELTGHARDTVREWGTLWGRWETHTTWQPLLEMPGIIDNDLKVVIGRSFVIGDRIPDCWIQIPDEG